MNSFRSHRIKTKLHIFLMCHAFALLASAHTLTVVPKDEVTMSAFEEKTNYSIMERAFILYLFNNAANKSVVARDVNIRTAYDKIVSFYEKSWRRGGLDNISRAEFLEIKNLSFKTRELFEKTYVDEEYFLDFSTLLDKNKNAIADDTTKASLAFWLSLVPCLDVGSGEIMAGRMLHGLQSNTKVWVASLGAAQNTIDAAKKSPGKLCGDGVDTNASALGAINELTPLLSEDEQNKLNTKISAQLKKDGVIAAILADTQYPKGSAEYNALSSKLTVLKEAVYETEKKKK